MYILLRSEIIGLFVDTLTADYKFSRHYSENFLQPVQMKLSKKQKIFHKISLQFWNIKKYLSNLKNEISYTD